MTILLLIGIPLLLLLAFMAGYQLNQDKLNGCDDE